MDMNRPHLGVGDGLERRHSDASLSPGEHGQMQMVQHDPLHPPPPLNSYELMTGDELSCGVWLTDSKGNTNSQTRGSTFHIPTMP